MRDTEGTPRRPVPPHFLPGGMSPSCAKAGSRRALHGARGTSPDRRFPSPSPPPLPFPRVGVGVHFSERNIGAVFLQIRSDDEHPKGQPCRRRLPAPQTLSSDKGGGEPAKVRTDKKEERSFVKKFGHHKNDCENTPHPPKSMSAMSHQPSFPNFYSHRTHGQFLLNHVSPIGVFGSSHLVTRGVGCGTFPRNQF